MDFLDFLWALALLMMMGLVSIGGWSLWTWNKSEMNEIDREWEDME